MIDFLLIWGPANFRQTRQNTLRWIADNMTWLSKENYGLELADILNIGKRVSCEVVSSSLLSYMNSADSVSSEATTYESHNKLWKPNQRWCLTASSSDKSWQVQNQQYGYGNFEQYVGKRYIIDLIIVVHRCTYWLILEKPNALIYMPWRKFIWIEAPENFPMKFL